MLPLVRHLTLTLKRMSVVFIVSDFVTDDDVLESPELAHLAAQARRDRRRAGGSRRDASCRPAAATCTCATSSPGRRVVGRPRPAGARAGYAAPIRAAARRAGPRLLPRADGPRVRADRPAARCCRCCRCLPGEKRDPPRPAARSCSRPRARCGRAQAQPSARRRAAPPRRRAAPPGVGAGRASVDRTAIWVGDRVTYTSTSSARRGVEILLDDLAKEKLRVNGLDVVGSDSTTTTDAAGPHDPPPALRADHLSRRHAVAVDRAALGALLRAAARAAAAGRRAGRARCRSPARRSRSAARCPRTSRPTRCATAARRRRGTPCFARAGSIGLALVVLSLAPGAVRGAVAVAAPDARRAGRRSARQARPDQRADARAAARASTSRPRTTAAGPTTRSAPPCASTSPSRARRAGAGADRGGDRGGAGARRGRRACSRETVSALLAHCDEARYGPPHALPSAQACRDALSTAEQVLGGTVSAMRFLHPGIRRGGCWRRFAVVALLKWRVRWRVRRVHVGPAAAALSATARRSCAGCRSPSLAVAAGVRRPGAHAAGHPVFAGRPLSRAASTSCCCSTCRRACRRRWARDRRATTTDGRRPGARGWTRSRTRSARFVRTRRDDRIGLVVFSDNPYVISPLTFDHEYLLHYIDFVDDKILQGEGQTAIGDGLALSNYVLSRQATPTSRGHQVVVLFTDGESNRGREPVDVLAEVEGGRHPRPRHRRRSRDGREGEAGGADADGGGRGRRRQATSTPTRSAI